ncbi:MAG TPA: cysteine desulfurase family protein [Acidimicrobiales bacterium]
MTGYLDHAATTPMRPEAVDAMVPWLRDRYGNPSASHRAGRAARRALDDARDAIAEVVGGEPGGVIFTSGGTEADNQAVTRAGRPGGVAVCSAVEHDAVLAAVGSTGGGRVVAVGADGRIDLDALGEALGPDVAVVSVMLVNNEVGVIQPIAAVVDVVRRGAPDAVVHCDAVQGVSWLDVAEHTAGVDLVTVSAHKVGGPKGVGALVARPGVSVRPLLVGGGQERDRRSGTQNVAGAVAFGVAARAAAEDRKALVDRITPLHERLVDGLVAAVPGVVVTAGWESDRHVSAPVSTPTATPSAPAPNSPTGCAPNRRRFGAQTKQQVSGIVHVCIPGVESEALLFLLDQAGVAASAASSCASGAMEPSHVLAAMGVDRALAAGSLRLSMGWSTTEADIDLALAVIPPAVARLRAGNGAG